MAWSLPSSCQDWHVESEASTKQGDVSAELPYTPAVGKTLFIALPKESEDARITGATRSLDRSLLALNLQGSRMSMSMLVKMTDMTETRIA
jgi:hypothetical protein